MCGITGVYKFDGNAININTIDLMAKKLSHRGPDGVGTNIIQPNLAFGHTRLSIIDLSDAGKQPMYSHNKEIVITFNGEIFNYLEIKKELIKQGYCFYTNTDTEVIICAYQQWGFDCIQHFNGMFAFALWDDKKNLLWLARDRMGEKPLFYSQNNKHFIFGSEIKAILEYPDVSAKINHQVLSYYLSLSYVPAPWTLFDNIYQLLPGEFMIVNQEGSIRKEKYWSANNINELKADNEDATQDRFQELLSDAIKIRTRSDVPYGVFLSGGLDSSTVAYYTSQLSEQPTNAFSMRFTEDSYDESNYAKLVAKEINVNHHIFNMPAILTDSIEAVVNHSEEPTADSSALAVYHLAQQTKKHVSVVLCGDGADELLAGYETYQAYYLLMMYKLIPGFLRNHFLKPLINALPSSTQKIGLEQKLKRFVYASQFTNDEAPGVWRTIFTKEQLKKLINQKYANQVLTHNHLSIFSEAFNHSQANHILNKLLYIDQVIYLPNDMLIKVDRMTMAFGLESRQPFLDHRLVAFLASLPPKFKLRFFLRKKHMLKKLMQNKLPQNIIHRKKAGFNVPKAIWMKSRLKEFMLDNLSDSRLKQLEFINSNHVRKMINEHLTGKRDYSFQLWNLLTLSLWWKTFKLSN